MAVLVFFFIKWYPVVYLWVYNVYPYSTQNTEGGWSMGTWNPFLKVCLLSSQPHLYIFILLFDQQVHILIHSVVTDVDAKIPTFKHKINNRYYIIGLHSQTEH